MITATIGSDTREMADAQVPRARAIAECPLSPIANRQAPHFAARRPRANIEAPTIVAATHAVRL